MQAVKSVLVIGATSGIGEALVYEYARKGFSILLAGRNVDLLQNLKSDLEIRNGVSASVHSFNAHDCENHGSFYASLPVKPDIVVYTIGYLGEQDEGQNNFGEAATIINVNFTYAVSILNIIANDFQKRKHGTIIGVSSVAGERGRQSNYLYGASKAAFSVYLDGLRNRLHPYGVHVMTVKPGFVATKMVEHLKLPTVLTADPKKLAIEVAKAASKRRNTIYVLWFWRYIMFVIKSVPEYIFKRMKL